MKSRLLRILLVASCAAVAGVTLHVSGSAAAAGPQERIGERINIFLGSPTEFAAGQPFHVVHGWLLTPDSTDHDAVGKYRFTLELDGRPVEPDFVERTSVDGRLDRFWVFNFPTGLSFGRHVFVARWWGPCLALVEGGFDVGGPCTKPTEPRVANGPLTRWVEFTDSRVGGTAVVGHDQEPLCLNALLQKCNFASAHWTAGVALPGAFRVTPSLSYQPVLIDRVDVAREPFTLTYHVVPDAVWSDGVPVSADDFIFTLRTTLQSAVPSREGYELITDAVRLDAKTVRFVFSRPYTSWRTLFPHVLPRHVLEAHDFNSVWDAEIADPVTHEPIGSGPFLVGRWERGQALTLIRNPRWWGMHRPFLDSVTVRFILDTNSRFQALISGAVDLLAPQPQFQIADLRTRPEIVVESRPGLALEHLDFNTNPAGMPLLREAWFRQAVAYSLDRSSLVPLLYGALGVSYGTQDSLIYPGGHESYLPSFSRYAYSPTLVRQLMETHGCATGADGIWVCGGIRASIKFATTTGNSLRDLAQQRLQGQARVAGIELIPDNSTAAVLFGTRLPAGDFELIMFAWIKGAEPGNPNVFYGCGGGQNSLGYCSPAVTNLFASSETEIEPLSRAGLLHEAEAALAEDIPSLPLFMRPDFLTYRKTLHGPQNNPEAGPTWNVEDWWTE